MKCQVSGPGLESCLGHFSFSQIISIYSHLFNFFPSLINQNLSTYFFIVLQNPVHALKFLNFLTNLVLLSYLLSYDKRIQKNYQKTVQDKYNYNIFLFSIIQYDSKFKLAKISQGMRNEKIRYYLVSFFNSPFLFSFHQVNIFENNQTL